MKAKSRLHATFCANLRAARKAKGLTQVEAAELLGISQAAYAAFESAKRAPGLLTIGKLADVLDVRPAELLDEIAAVA